MNRYLGANIGQIYLVVLVDIMFKYRIHNWMFIMIYYVEGFLKLWYPQIVHL